VKPPSDTLLRYFFYDVGADCQVGLGLKGYKQKDLFIIKFGIIFINLIDVDDGVR
jgi:hypothetical protein